MFLQTIAFHKFLFLASSKIILNCQFGVESTHRRFSSIPKVVVSLFLFLALQVSYLLAQPGAVDPTFDPGAGAEWGGSVYAIKVQPDGKVLVGGYFSSYNGISCNNLIRLNPDGSVDQTFNVNVNSSVLDIAVQPDGKIIIAGVFSFINSTYNSYLGRLLQNGTIDTTFNPGYINGSVRTVSLQSDGKLIIGGGFSIVGGISRGRIARLSTNGTLDSSFANGTGFDSQVSKIKMFGSSLYVVGYFANYNNAAAYGLIKLDQFGNADASFNIGTGFSSDIYAIDVQPDGKLILGGRFFYYQGILTGCIARLDSFGNYDYSFSIGSGFSNTVNAIKIQNDGKILAGGVFESYSGISARGITRLNTSGSQDNTFSSGNGADDWVYTFETQSDGKIFFGGQMIGYNSIPSLGVGRLSVSGVYDSSFNVGAGCSFQYNYANVNDIAIQNDLKVIVGGAFGRFNLQKNRNIARLNLDGSIDPTFLTGRGFIDGFVNDIEIQPDQKIICVGSFIQFGNYYQSVNKIIRLLSNGSNDVTFFSGSGIAGGDPYVVKVVPSTGNIIVGGGFSTYNTTPVGKLVKLNPSGSLDITFNTNIGSGSNYAITSIAIDNNNKILLGGEFTTFNGNVANGIIRLNLDGTIDNTFQSYSGFNGSVTEIKIQSDGKIVVAGTFDFYQGIYHPSMVRLNPNGSIDNSFNTLNNYSVSSFAFDQTNVVLSGFDPSSQSNKVLRLNSFGNVDNAFLANSDQSGDVTTVETDINGKYLIGGYFEECNNLSRPKIARLFSDFGPITIEATDSTLCPGQSIIFTENTAGANSKSWSFPGGSPATSTSFNPVVSYSSPGQYMVIVTVNSVLGTATDTFFNFITVNPTPSISTTFANQTFCNGANTIAISLSGPVAGTSYGWGAVSSIGLFSSSSTTSFPAFTTTNATNAPSTGSVTITPTANGCVGPTKSFSVTVNPTPSITTTFSAQTVCNGANTTAIALSGPVAGTSYGWGAVSSIGLFSGSSTTSFPAFTTTNATNAPSTGSVTITPTANGCVGPTKSFSVTVNPIPSISTTFANPTVCNNTNTTAIALNGPVANTSYGWGAVSSIGLSLGSSTTSFPSFTATNSGNNPIAATVIITPTANGCTGTPEIFSFTVNPTPGFNNTFANQTVCNGANTTAIALAGSVTGTSFSWGVVSSIGLFSGSSTTSFPAFTATNATNAPVTDSVTITPTAKGCVGPTKSFSVTVNPTPVVNPLSDQSVCAKSPIQDIRFQGLVDSTSFSWTRTAGIIGLGTTGSGDIVDFRPVNTGSTPITTTITVTPSAATCVGDPVSFDLTVYPLPPKAVVAWPPSICANQVGIPVTTATPAHRYKWSILSGNAVVTSPDSSKAFLQTFRSGTQHVQLRIITVSNLECKDTADVQIPVSNTARDTADVTLLPINNTFQCLDATTGTNYQWGYDDLNTLEEVKLIGEVFGDYVAGNSLDTANRNYWVKTTYPNETCEVKSYYKRDNSYATTSIPAPIKKYPLSVYPNPATSEVNIAWESAQSGMITLEVFDLNGKKIYSLEHFALQGEQVLAIETGLWSRGTYYVKLKSPSNEFRSARILLL